MLGGAFLIHLTRSDVKKTAVLLDLGFVLHKQIKRELRVHADEVRSVTHP